MSGTELLLFALIAGFLIVFILVMRILFEFLPDMQDELKRVRSISNTYTSNIAALEKYLGVKYTYNGYKYVKLTAKERKENHG